MRGPEDGGGRGWEIFPSARRQRDSPSSIPFRPKTKNLFYLFVVVFSAPSAPTFFVCFCFQIQRTSSVSFTLVGASR